MNKIIYLGHASFLLKNDSFEAVIDPYKDGSVPNLTFPKGLVADAVFCSHEHADHNASELVKIKDNPTAIKTIDTIVPHDPFGGSKRGLNKIRMFDMNGQKVVHLGDTGCVLDEKTLKPYINCDILLAPINGYFTIGPAELKKICQIINPRILVPMHYYMKEHQSGYPDNNIFEEFRKEFSPIEYLDKELDIDQYLNYQGVLAFKNYLQ